MLETATQFLDSRWFSLLIGIFILGMVLHGHSCGFIRLSVSLMAVVITIIAVRTALPYATDYLRTHTKAEERIESYITSVTGLDTLTEEQTGTESSQLQIISGMDLPEGLQDILKENNTKEIWKRLGVKHFTDYISGYLGHMFLNYICFAVLFVAIWMVLHLLLKVLDIFTRLPVIHGMNQIAGALLGLFEALIFVWIAFLLIMLFAGTGPGGRLHEMIAESPWLTFLYRYNMVGWFLKGLLNAAL